MPLPAFSQGCAARQDPPAAADYARAGQRQSRSIPQSDGDRSRRFVPTRDRGSMSCDLVGGPSQVRVFDLAGQGAEIGAGAAGLLGWSGGAPRRRRSAVSHRDLRRSARLVSLRPPRPTRPTSTALFRTSPADFSDCEVVREFATSKDGTKVPMNILRRKGTKLDGKNPTLLNGYGGYGISLTPRFRLGRNGLARAGRRLSPSPTSAAAANTARTGTTPAISPRSKTSSTTSSPACRNT